MTLFEAQQSINLSNSTPTINQIFDQIQLINFSRSSDGAGFKTFNFEFTHKSKKYILKHTFSYHGAGVDNWFKLKKPSIFSPKPFHLTNDQLCELSAMLLKAVNKINF